MEHQQREVLTLAVIGAGAFAKFAIPHLMTGTAVQLTSVADVDEERARELASSLPVQQQTIQQKTIEGILNDSTIDVVYVATPPASHASLALRALEADKHVLSEKPLALDVEDANVVLTTANQKDRFAVSNLLQRYNPLARSIQQLVHTGALGAPLYAVLENCASDEHLALDHWFWDPQISGGIFLEHGVHFFDLFAYWFGPGTVVSSERGLRPESGIEERVRCTISYPGGISVDMSHAFTQPQRLEHTEIRLQFERGHVHLTGWIPTKFRLEGLVDDATEAELYALFPDSGLEQVVDISRSNISGRHKVLNVTKHIVLVGGSDDAETKSRIYGELVHHLFTDQLTWVHDPTHFRLLDEQLSRDAVSLACAANRKARTIEP
jgi:predicted dehydrogenase